MNHHISYLTPFSMQNNEAAGTGILNVNLLETKIECMNDRMLSFCISVNNRFQNMLSITLYPPIHKAINSINKLRPLFNKEPEDDLEENTVLIFTLKRFFLLNYSPFSTQFISFYGNIILHIAVSATALPIVTQRIPALEFSNNDSVIRYSICEMTDVHTDISYNSRSFITRHDKKLFYYSNDLITRVSKFYDAQYNEIPSHKAVFEVDGIVHVNDCVKYIDAPTVLPFIMEGS